MPRSSSKHSYSKVSAGDEVHIQWADAISRSGWNFDNTPVKLAQIVSSGFVVDVCPTYITIAGDLSLSNGVTGRCQSIPKGCINSVKVVKKKAASPDFFLTPPRR